MSNESVVILFVLDLNWSEFIVSSVTGIFIYYHSHTQKKRLRKKLVGKSMSMYKYIKYPVIETKKLDRLDGLPKFYREKLVDQDVISQVKSSQVTS